MVSNRSKRPSVSNSRDESFGDLPEVIGNIQVIKERWEQLPNEFFFDYEEQKIFDIDGLVVVSFQPDDDNPNGVNWPIDFMREALTEAPKDIKFLLHTLCEYEEYATLLENKIDELRFADDPN